MSFTKQLAILLETGQMARWHLIPQKDNDVAFGMIQKLLERRKNVICKADSTGISGKPTVFW